MSTLPPNAPSPDFNSDRLSDPLAARLLERASEIDARGQSGATVAELRRAAEAAGISEQAFDLALAELQQLQQSPPIRPDRQPTHYSRAVRFAALSALVLVMPLVVLFTLRSVRSPVNAGADRLVEAMIPLTCLSAPDASQRLQALVMEEARQGNGADKMRISFTSRAPRVLQVRATPAWVTRMRAKLAEIENAPGTECTVPGANTPSP